MANTYSQIHLHFIICPKYREALIHPRWEKELYKYISGIVGHKGHKLIIINGMPDHIHMLIGFRPIECISRFMCDVKAHSSKWINRKRLIKGKFKWQNGYSVFACSKNDLPRIIKYIKNQKEHHCKIQFIEEYKTYLEEYNIEFKEEFIFQAPE